MRDRGRHRGIVGIEVVEPAERSGHVAEHGSVEVDAAQPLDAFGRAEDGEAVAGRAQHGHVERAATEVVDRDRLAGLDPLGARVVNRRGLRLGKEPDRRVSGARQAREVHGLLEEVLLVCAPVRGMGDRDRRGHLALAVRDGVDDPAQQLCREELGGVRGASEQDRGRIADPALELAGDAFRLAEHATVGRLADQHRSVRTDVDDRGHRRLARAQVDDRRALSPPHRGGRPRRAEIDPELVGHAPNPVKGTPRRLGAA